MRFFTKFVQTVRRYSSAFNDIGGDIVHLNTPYNFQPAIAAARSDVDLVWHFNDTLTPWPLNSIASESAKRLADSVVADSEQVVEYYSLQEAHTRVIYPCVSLEKFTPTGGRLHRDFAEDDGRPKIGCIANINPVKGQEYLIRALPEVVDAVGPVSVRFAGAKLESQEKYYHNLKELVASLGLQEHVSFIGWQSDIAGFLEELDLVVIPSVSESGPISLLEAMAMEVPVVTTDVGIVREQIESGTHAWVVPPESVDELEVAISDALISPHKRREYANNARELVTSEFSLEVISDQYLELYHNCVE